MQSVNSARDGGAHRFHPSILRAYDIRGVVGENLTETDALYIGKAFGTKVRRSGGKKACLTYDSRPSSVPLVKAVTEGLTSAGIDVVNLGLGPTSLGYFGMQYLKMDACLVVTGSHTPAPYNGVKMATSSGPFYGKDIQALAVLAASGDFETGSGTAETADIAASYIDRLIQGVSLSRPLRIAWDCGNGAAGNIVRALTAKLPGTHILLYDTVDGTFPNHHPDPSLIENLQDLIKAVRDNGCDFGVAFDGDGDRIGVVDEKGTVIWPDRLLALYATALLKENPGATIVADVKSSHVLFDEITRLGGRAVMCRAGHSYIKAKLLEENALLAGEFTGHICFADRFYGVDDALYCALRLYELVGKAAEPLSALAARLPETYAVPEIRITVSEDRQFDIPAEIRDRLITEGQDATDLDGVRVTTPDGWWLIRSSNTENGVISVRMEAHTPESLERLKTTVLNQLQESNVEPPHELAT